MIRFLITVYIYILVFDAILSFFPDIRKYPWAQLIKRISDATCKPVRKYIPDSMGFDISHFIVIIILQTLKVLW